MRKSLILFFLVLLISAADYAYSGDGRFKWWKDPQVVDELDLTQNQVERIEGIFSYYKGQIVQLDAELKEKEESLRDKIRDPNADSQEISILANDVEQVKASLARLDLDMRLQIREVLTPDQRVKILKFKEGRYKGRRR